jgi:serine/threonine protein kinase
MHLKQPPEPPRRRSPDIPEELERIILRLLAKKPEQRYADCGELAIALERIRERLRAADAISGNPPAESNDQ